MATCRPRSIDGAADTLHGAGMAAREKAHGFKMSMTRSYGIVATNAGGGVFCFTDGSAVESQEVIDAVTAHEVAHEALGHMRQTSVTSVAISACSPSWTQRFSAYAWA